MSQNSVTSPEKPFDSLRSNGWEESQKYKGVEKFKNVPIYVALVCEDDHETQSKRKTYLGKYDKEEDAARAHDLMTLKLKGSEAETNFPKSNYKESLEAVADMTQTEVVTFIKSLSSFYHKLVSIYHGVTRHVTGKWQASYGIGRESRVLGLFDSEQEAAKAYDVEGIRLMGVKALTNFDIKSYNIPAILNGETNAKSIYNTVKVIEPMEMVRKNNDTPTLEKFLPFMVSSIRKFEDQWRNNVASSVDTTLSLALPAIRKGYGEGSSTSPALNFSHATSNSCKELKRRKLEDPPQQE